MPNINAPFGLRPVRHVDGRPYNGAVNAYYIPASYATALFIGDPVIKTGTANTARVRMPGAGEFDIGTLPEINKAAAGTTNRITGVIVNFASVDQGSLSYNPASTERIAFVCDDPDTLFEIQASGALGAVDISTNSVLTYAVAGSTVTGWSGAQLDQSVLATTAAHQLNIVRLVNRVDNEPGSTAVKALVRINNHTETPGVAGI
jgi:hypothetical protein